MNRRESTDAMASAIGELLLLIEDFMPNIGRCVLQDYQRLNEAPIEARKAVAAYRESSK